MAHLLGREPPHPAIVEHEAAAAPHLIYMVAASHRLGGLHQLEAAILRVRTRGCSIQHYALEAAALAAATPCILAAARLLEEAAERHVLVAAQLDARLAQRH